MAEWDDWHRPGTMRSMIGILTITRATSESVLDGLGSPAYLRILHVVVINTPPGTGSAYNTHRVDSLLLKPIWKPLEMGFRRGSAELVSASVLTKRSMP